MRRWGLLALAAIGGAAGFVLAGPVAVVESVQSRFDGPGVPAGLREASPGRLALERQCLICHGLPIIAGQRLTAAQWSATVTKMREKFGAPLAAGSEDEAQIVGLLAGALPPELPAEEVGRAWAPAGPEAAPSLAEVSSPAGWAAAIRGGQRFAATCATCHGAEARGGANGPRLVGRPILADPIAFQRLLASGRGAMPRLAEADSRVALDLLAHLRALTAKER